MVYMCGLQYVPLVLVVSSLCQQKQKTQTLLRSVLVPLETGGDVTNNNQNNIVTSFFFYIGRVFPDFLFCTYSVFCLVFYPMALCCVQDVCVCVHGAVHTTGRTQGLMGCRPTWVCVCCGAGGPVGWEGEWEWGRGVSEPDIGCLDLCSEKCPPLSVVLWFDTGGSSDR